jgi:predicted RNA-binding Zn-ribbon protein involved in translation (DUF1610 family)
MRLLLILALTAAFGMLLSALLMPTVAAPTEANHGLISLEQHQEQRAITNDLLYRAHETLTNIACPKCGKALWKDLSVVLTSCPPQSRIWCKGCGWSGSTF